MTDTLLTRHLDIVFAREIHLVKRGLQIPSESSARVSGFLAALELLTKNPHLIQDLSDLAPSDFDSLSQKFHQKMFDECKGM